MYSLIPDSLSRLLLSDILIPKQSPLPTGFVVHNGQRVSELPKLPAWNVMRRVVHRLSLQVSELGDPVSDVNAVWVAFFGLGQGVEDALKLESVERPRTHCDVAGLTSYVHTKYG